MNKLCNWFALLFLFVCFICCLVSVAQQKTANEMVIVTINKNKSNLIVTIVVFCMLIVEVYV